MKFFLLSCLVSCTAISVSSGSGIDQIQSSSHDERTASPTTHNHESVFPTAMSGEDGKDGEMYRVTSGLVTVSPIVLQNEGEFPGAEVCDDEGMAYEAPSGVVLLVDQPELKRAGKMRTPPKDKEAKTTASDEGAPLDVTQPPRQLSNISLINSLGDSTESGMESREGTVTLGTPIEEKPYDPKTLGGVHERWEGVAEDDK